MRHAIISFRKVLTAVMLLGPLVSLFPVMPSASAIIVKQRWSKRSAVVLTLYRVLMAAFMAWLGWF